MFPREINVVGNAHSLFEKNYGEQIDSLPTIRFNYLENLVKEKQGSRWDYMATSDPKMINKWNQAKSIPFHTLIFTIWAEKEKRHIAGNKYKNADVYRVPDPVWRKLSESTPRPSTGLSVIHMLDCFKIERVNIYGFDFKKTHSYYNSQAIDTNQSSMHNYDMEEKFVMDIIDKNNWNIFR